MIIMMLHLAGLVFAILGVVCSLRANNQMETGEVFKLNLPIRVANNVDHIRMRMIGDFMRGSRRNKIIASIAIILGILGILMFVIAGCLFWLIDWTILEINSVFMVAIILTLPFDLFLPVQLYHYWEKHSSEAFTLVDSVRRQVAFKWQWRMRLMMNLMLIAVILYG